MAERSYRLALINLMRGGDEKELINGILDGSVRQDGTMMAATAIYAVKQSTLQWMLDHRNLPIDAPEWEPDGWNALQHVCALGFYQRAHLLLDYGANPHVLTVDGFSLLDLIDLDDQRPGIARINQTLRLRREPIDYLLIRRLLAARVKMTTLPPWWRLYQKRCYQARQAALSLLLVGRLKKGHRDVFLLIAQSVYDTRHLPEWTPTRGLAPCVMSGVRALLRWLRGWL